MTSGLWPGPARYGPLQRISLSMIDSSGIQYYYGRISKSMRTGEP